MTISSRPSRGLVIAGVHSWFARSLILLCSLFALGWSQQAAATIGCEIQDTSVSPSQQAAPNGTLNYSFTVASITGGCSGTVSGTVTLQAGETTGGASSDTFAWSTTAGNTINVVITVGPNYGGSASFHVDCTTGCFNGTSTLFWAATTSDQFSLTADPPTSFNLVQGQVATLNAHYFRNGVDNNDSTIWTVDDPNGVLTLGGGPIATDDSTGLVTNGFYSYTPGSYTVSVDGNPSECGATCPLTIFYNITVEQLVLSPFSPPGGTGTTPPNSAITLTVEYAGTSLTATDGTNIEWQVVSEPVGPGSSAIFTGAFPNPGFGSQLGTDTTGGKSSAELNVTVPGTYVVDACYAPDGCSGSPEDNTEFTITVPVPDADLSVTKTDSPDPVVAGDQLTYTITAHNAGPDTAASASMDDVLPGALTFVSISSPAGWSCTTPAVGSNGSINCSNPSFAAGGADPVFTLVTAVDIATPGGSTITNSATMSSTTTGDSVPGNNSATTTTTVAAPAPAMTVVKNLAGTVDNDSSGNVSAGDQLNYTVTAKNTGNVVLNAVAVSDDHFPTTQSCPTLAPNATCVLNGSYIVTTADANTGSVTNIGSATSTEVAGPITSTVITPVATAADLSVTKTDSPDPVLLGSQITYTITVHTAGPDSALSTSLSDTLPADLSFVSLSSPGGWSCTTPAVGASGTISCSNPQVDVGPDAVFTLVTTVSPTATGASISNTTTVSSTTSDPTPGNNSATATTTLIAPSATLSVTKVLSGTVDNDSSGSVSAGDQLNYTVTATNSGNVPLTGVVVSDDHFPATQTCPAVAPAGTCVLTGSYIVTVGDAGTGSVTNVGSATSNEAAGPFTSSVVTPVGSAADLSVTKTDSPDPVLLGSQLTYTITVHTAGPDSALQVVLNDALPADLSFVSLGSPAGWSCTTPAVGANGAVNCTNPQFDVGPDAVFTLVTTVSPSATGASVNNTATVSSNTGDANPGNNSATASTALVAPSTSLGVVKILQGSVDNDSSGTISTGDQLNYQVTATNNGNVPLTGVVVSDDHFPATQTCPALAPTATCVLTGSYIVTAADTGNGSITNIGSATSNEAAGPYTSTVVTPIGGTADLSITKTDNPDPVAAGGQLTYTITVNDAGPGNAVQPVWTDILPAQLGFVSLAAPAAWTCTTPAVGASGTVSCTRPGIGPGPDAVFTLVTSVAANTTSGSTITNTASIQSSTPDPNNANDSATSTTTVGTGTAALSVAKVLDGTVDNDSSGAVSAGDRLDYTVTATNSGNVTLTNVVVTDNHFTATQTCPTLAPSATCVLSGSYIVTAADASNGTITNVGSATSTEASATVSSSVITPITAPATLSVGTGDGQTAETNTPFADPLTVIANGGSGGTGGTAGVAGKLAAAVTPGVTINWTVVSGSATLSSSSSVTNASGIASINAFAGPTPGPVVIRAARADDPSVTADFHLTVVAPQAKLGELPGLTPNQKALADAIDAFCSDSTNSSGNAGLADLLARCQELIDSIATDPSGVLKALDELFADIALVQSESSLLAAESQFENIKARIAALRSGTVGTSFGGLAFNNASGRLPIGSMFQGLLADDQPAEKKEIGADFSRWGFFAAGTIGRGDTDQGSLSPAYDFDIAGLTVGADYRFSDKLIFGGTLGLTKQTNDLTHRKGSLDTSGWSISGYGTWYQQNSWYMDGVLSYGKNSYDIERQVRYTLTTPTGTTTIDQTGRANGDGDSLTFALSVGRDFNKKGWGFGPYLRGMYTKMQFDPMAEEFKAGQAGAGLALELDTRTVTSLTSTLGAKLTKAHSTSWGVIIPHMQFEWQHEFETDPAEVEARFLFDPTSTPFTIHGDPVDTDFFRFGVGMSFVMTHGRSGFFYYERLISRERFNQNSLALGIRIEF